MGDLSSRTSSNAGEGSSKPSKEPVERAQMSQKSQSDPAASGLSRSFSTSHVSSSGAASRRRPSKQSWEENSAVQDDDDDELEEEQEEEEKPKMKKRHSSHSHTNVHTECGRHGDDWLFGGISDAVKAMLGKK